jgi:DNA-binding GntR family transcriptional regulator
MAEGAAKLAEKPRNLVETMCRQLADDIVEGVLLPGVRLDEVGLAERFRTSRTPVREALRQLEAMGVVQRRPNRGVVVATVTAERLAQMFEAMAELEAVCARLAALRMTPRERRALERLHAKSAEHVAAGREAGYEHANRLFHQALYAGAHNDEIRSLA